MDLYQHLPRSRAASRQSVLFGSLSALALLLTACGGGGGSTAPVAAVGGAGGGGGGGGGGGSGGSASDNPAAVEAATTTPDPGVTSTVADKPAVPAAGDAGAQTAATLARVLEMEIDTPDAPRFDAKSGSRVAQLNKPQAADGRGQWSAPTGWPIIGIHAVLTPNGKVMSYGTDQAGQQGAQLFYDVWNPTGGIHNLLANTTGTDIFCSAQLVLPQTGQVLLAGGDIRGQQIPDGNGGVIFNRGVKDVNLFDPASQTLTPARGPMTYARWYDSLVTLADGRVLTMGGSDASGTGVKTPEIYADVRGGWTPLAGVNYPGDVLYPRTFLAPNGKVVIASGAQLYSLDTNGDGALEQVGALPVATNWTMPSAMFDRGKVLIASGDGSTSVLDINGAAPVVTPTAPVGGNRIWATMTVLADGQVLATGGSARANEANDVALSADIWNPRTGQWTVGPSQLNFRLYHSTALLLPDATVLVAGGGAPGPARQLNAEIYSPPYLFAKDGTGNRATRPYVWNASAELALGRPYRMYVYNRKPIARVHLVRTGSVTHSINFDQRFLSVPFRQRGWRLDLNVDEPSNIVPPGHYMLFAIDSDGVPSIAKIVHIGPRAG